MKTDRRLPLTDAEIATYERDGYLVVDSFQLPDDLLGKLRRAADRVIAASAERDLILVAHLPRRDGVVGGLDGGEELFEVATDPTLLDVVEQLIGPDIVLWGSSIFAKPSGVGKEVQWHQEANYWPMKPLVTTSLWIAINDATPDNGCLRFIPGSHREGLLPHTSQSGEGVLEVRISPDAIDADRSKDAPAAAGHVVALDSWVVHGSRANVSAAPRAAFTVRYMPATSHFDRHHVDQGVFESAPVTGWPTRPIWLVRGANRHPGNDFTIGHEHLADLDERARLVVAQAAAGR